MEDFFLRIVQMSTNMRFEFCASINLFNLPSSIILISPSKLPMTDKVQIEDLLVQTLSILLKTIGKDSKFLPVLARIFDPTIPFYHGKLFCLIRSIMLCNFVLVYFSGSKMGYTFATGMPHVRINLARRFADNKGYDILISALSNPLYKWTSAEVFLHILKLLHVQEVFG